MKKERLKINRKNYETVFSFKINGMMGDPIVPTPPPPPSPFPPLVVPPGSFAPEDTSDDGWPTGINPLPPVEYTGPVTWKEVVIREVERGGISILSGDGYITAYDEEQIPAINAWMDSVNILWQVGTSGFDCGAGIRGGPGTFVGSGDKIVSLGMYPVGEFLPQTTGGFIELGKYFYEFIGDSPYPSYRFFSMEEAQGPGHAGLFKEWGFYLEQVGPEVIA